MNIRLYQLADSALPTGGFVFSSGMESAFTLGWIASLKDLQKYLMGVVHSFAHNELRFVKMLFDELKQKDTIGEELQNDYHASLSSLGMRRGSLLQGESWNRVIQRLYPQIQQQNFLRAHFIPTYCSTLFHLRHSLEEALQLLYFIFVRDQVSAAVRLGICGPMDGQQMQSQLLKMESKVMRTSMDRSGLPLKTAACWEVSQAMHSRVYSTLFQN